MSAVNIAIHALAMTFVIRIARRMRERPIAGSSMFMIQVMIVTVMAITLAHLCEVVVWALAYGIVGAVPTAGSGSKIYFAFVNYTTLGYGDIVPVERWRLLGPMAALNGVLLIGWSTAVIFEVLRRSIALSAFDDKAPGERMSGDALPPKD